MFIIIINREIAIRSMKFGLNKYFMFCCFTSLLLRKLSLPDETSMLIFSLISLGGKKKKQRSELHSLFLGIHVNEGHQGRHNFREHQWIPFAR